MAEHLLYHVPVLATECIDALQIDPEGIYLDLTFGGGGHSRLILEKLGLNGRLFAFDQDSDALANVPDDARFTLIQANFRHLKRFLKLYGVDQVNGILADLGVSSHQFDEADRGFTFRNNSAPLDMRMSAGSPTTAADLLNTLEERRLTFLFREYAELQNAYKVAQAVIFARNIKPFETAADVLNALRGLYPREKENNFFARVFQALRIEVNEEMEVLEEMLEQCAEVILPGGRLVVLSYHSLEDRLVKHFMKAGNAEGKLSKDFFGNDLKPFKPLNAKAISPSEEEIARNSRARSAKLRIATRL